MRETGGWSWGLGTVEYDVVCTTRSTYSENAFELGPFLGVVLGYFQKYFQSRSTLLKQSGAVIDSELYVRDDVLEGMLADSSQKLFISHRLLTGKLLASIGLKTKHTTLKLPVCGGFIPYERMEYRELVMDIQVFQTLTRPATKIHAVVPSGIEIN